MFAFINRRRLAKTESQLLETNDKLVAAYDRLLDPLRDTDFRAYCAKYGADHDGLMMAAREKIARQNAMMERRRATSYRPH